MPTNLTRIKNNQITDTTIVANAKIVPYSISSTLLANNLTYGSDLTITGNLTVQGNSTAIDTTITTIEDPVILLASTQTGAPTVDIGFIGDRGASSNVALVWREANSEFITAYTSTGETNTTISISSYANFHTNDANVSGNLTIGGNVIGNITFDGTLTAGNLATPGTVSATGNVTGGNVLTAGQVSATGNLTGGNVLTAGSVSATANITGGNLTTSGTVDSAAVSASGNITGGNVLTTGIVSATGNVTGNYFIGNGSQLTGVAANTATQIINGTSNVNIASANANITMGVDGTADVVVVNPNGANINGYLYTSGNVDGANVTASASLTGANIYTGGIVSATGTVFAGNVDASTGTVGANTVNANTVSAAGNVTSNNVNVSTQISAGGNVIGANFFTVGEVSATGNVTGNYFIGNGSQLTGIDATRIINGTSNVSIPAPNGNIEMTVNGTANVILVTSTGANVTGYANITGDVSAANASITGNVNSGNVLSSGEVSATGNVYGNAIVTSNIIGLTQVTMSTLSGDIVINPAGGNIDVSTAWINNLSDPVNNQDAATKKYVDDVAQGLNIHDSTQAATTANLATISGGTVTYNNGNAGVGANLVTTGTYTNIDGVAINTVGTRILVKNESNTAWNGIYTYSNATVLVRATDYDTVPEVEPGDFVFNLAGNVYGNTGWVQTSNTVTIGTGPIEFTQFSGAGSYTAGNGISITGTVINAIYDGNITVNGSNQLSIANGAILLNPNITDATGTGLSLTGNLDAGNIRTAGMVTATGNVYGGNLVTVGNVEGANVLSGGLVSAGSNVIGANLLTAGNVSATGGITSADGIVGNTLTSNTIITAVGNITGGNILTGGDISATGNLTANNISTSGSGGNITGANVIAATTLTASGNIVTGQFFVGDGAYISNINAANVAATKISNGTSQANIGSAGGNLAITINNNATANFYDQGLSVFGNVSSNATINTSQLSLSGNIISDTSVSGNVNAYNFNTTGLVSAGGNVTGGNIFYGSGVVSGTGNIYADTIFANISGNIDAAGNLYEVQFNTTGDLLGANANFTYDFANNVFTVNGGNINGGNVSATGTVTGGNLTVGGDSIDGTNGIITINGASADTNFAVNGDTVANVFFVDAGTGTASFGSDAQTVNAIVAFNATNSILMPVGNTAERPSGVTGMLRFNTTLNYLEVYNNSQWQEVGQDTFTVITDEQFNGDGSTVQFTLGSTQTTSSVMVSINGVVQIPTTAYAVSGTYPTCYLTFTEAPQSGDVIDVREFTTTVSVGSISSGNSSVTATGSTVDVQGNLNPTADLTYSLGNATNRWSNLYVGGNTIYLGNLQLKEASANTFAVYTADGITEANIAVGNIDVTSIQSGNSSISIAAPNGNAVLNANGVNAVVAASTGAYVTGVVSATGNIVGSYIIGNGSQLTGLPAGYSNANAASFLAAFGSNTISTTGTVTSGNVTASNLLTGGLISAASTITGGTLLAGGISLTGNSITSANSTITIDPNGAGGVNGAVIIAGNLSVQGNVTYIDSNVITTNEKSITLANNQSTGAALDGSGIDIGNANQYYWRFNNATTSWQANIGITPAANATLNLGGTSNYWASLYATGATVSGTMNTGAIYSTNEISAAGTVTGANFSTVGNVQTSGGRFYASNGPSVAILTGSAFTIDGTISASGNVTGGNLFTAPSGILGVGDGGSPGISAAYIYANGAIALNNPVGGYITASGNITGGNLFTAGSVSATGNVTGGNIATGGGFVVLGNSGFGDTGSAGIYNSYIYANGVANVKGVTTTGTVSATGNITGGNLSVSTGTVTLGNIVNANGNGVGNIGSSSLYFNTVFAKATSAQYADLAENYVADAQHQPGTVVAFGGTREVTLSDVNGDRRVAGVVSTNPSYIMNAGCAGEFVVTVALTGRVPTRVTGQVRKGDMMVSNGDGTARSEANPQVGSVIGKALANWNGEGEGMIEVVIGRF